MDDKLTVRIKEAPGPYRREMGGYVWEAANGFTAAVDIRTAAELLTHPSQAFSLAERPSAAARKALADALGVKPENVAVPGEAVAPAEATVSQIAGGSRAPRLAELGITRAGQLAALDEEGIERLAVSTGASRAEVQAWVEQARN